MDVGVGVGFMLGFRVRVRITARVTVRGLVRYCKWIFLLSQCSHKVHGQKIGFLARIEAQGEGLGQHCRAGAALWGWGCTAGLGQHCRAGAALWGTVGASV